MLTTVSIKPQSYNIKKQFACEKQLLGNNLPPRESNVLSLQEIPFAYQNNHFLASNKKDFSETEQAENFANRVNNVKNKAKNRFKRHTEIPKMLEKLILKEKISIEEAERLVNEEIGDFISDKCLEELIVSLMFYDLKTLPNLREKEKNQETTGLIGDTLIRYYTNNQYFYSYLNSDLKNEESSISPKIKLFDKELRKALDKLPDYKGTVIRKQTEFDEFFQLEKLMEENKTFKPGQYWSTSTPTGKFRCDYKFIFVIKTKTGKKVDSFSDFSEEQEVIIKPDTEFKILKIQNATEEKKGTKKIKIIYLEEI